MGRPLRKDVNGVDVIGTFGTDSNKEAGIRVEFFDTQLRTDGIIIKQRGAKTFVVARVGVVDANLTKTSPNFTCVLQAAEPSAAGQMRILGSVSGTTPGDIAIAKIGKRIARDFSNNAYTWEMVNFEDSTEDSIKLTPVA